MYFGRHDDEDHNSVIIRLYISFSSVGAGRASHANTFPEVSSKLGGRELSIEFGGGLLIFAFLVCLCCSAFVALQIS